MQKVWDEIKEFATIRRDPLYKVMGRMVWGRWWGLPLILIVLIGQFSIATHRFFIVYSGIPLGALSYWLDHIVFILIQFSVPISVIFIWGYFPFSRSRARQVLADLNTTSLDDKTVYRIFSMHTLIAFLLVYVFEQLFQIVGRHLLIYPEGTPWWHDFASQTYSVMNHYPVEQQGVYLVYALFSDVLRHVSSLLIPCLFPVLIILMMMGYWKSHGMGRVVRRTLLYYVSFQIVFIGYMTAQFLARYSSENASDLIDRSVIYSASLIGLGVCFICDLWRKVIKIPPFAEKGNLVMMDAGGVCNDP